MDILLFCILFFYLVISAVLSFGDKYIKCIGHVSTPFIFIHFCQPMLYGYVQKSLVVCLFVYGITLSFKCAYMKSGLFLGLWQKKCSIATDKHHKIIAGTMYMSSHRFTIDI